MSASVVRNAVLALSLADAALPVATAAKYAPSDPTAPIRIASSRRDTTISAASFYDRRIRAYRDSFPLFLGVGY